LSDIENGFSPTLRFPKSEAGPLRLKTAVLTIILACLPSAAPAVKIQTYTYEYLCGEERKPITMTVESDTEKVVVAYHNEFNDHEIMTYDHQVRLLGAVYIDSEGRETGRVAYDYDRKVIRITGQYQAQFNLTDPTYDNNGSLFYLFAHRYPAAPEKDWIFYLAQSNLNRITDPISRFLITQLVGPVEMYLHLEGEEAIQLADQPRTALRYVLAIHDGRLAPFWPNRYHFWYAPEDRTLLRYDGLTADRKMAVVQLVKYSESEYPTPELPSL
jgi:hypothetical protein